MCELYPRLASCCGISPRVCMVYISVLSIVTGAMVNSMLKKAGVNVASVKEITDLQKGNQGFKAALRTETPIADDDYVHPAVTHRRKPIVITKQFTTKKIDATKNTKTTKKPFVTSKITRSYKRDGDETTVEIVDDSAFETTALEAEQLEKSFRRRPEESDSYYEDDVTLKTTRKWKQEKEKDKVTLTTSALIRRVAKVNRHGLNFMSVLYIALGIYLLAANFMNSTEMALLYVFLAVGTALLNLILLVGVVAECNRNATGCLLKGLDPFSGFLVTLIWFIYIFLWFLFAAIANHYANFGGR